MIRVARGRRAGRAILPLLLVAATGGGCGTEDADEPAEALGGRLEIAAAGTAYPFAQAAAEQFQIDHPDVTITVERSDGAAVFDRFCRGRAALAASPRPIGEDGAQTCAGADVAYTERLLPPDGSDDFVHVYRSRDALHDAAVSALDEFMAAHHEFIADAARRGRRALSP